MSALLEGVRVVDVAGYVTGPYACMILGDLGADVVKVEAPPKGDPMRSFGLTHDGTSVLFANVNRNKRSILLNLKSADGRTVFLDLVRRADVLVQNWRPGVARSLGLDDATLAAENPRLIRLAVTGYGREGPLSSRPAFDTLLQGHTSMAHVQGAGHQPEIIRSILADKTTALFGAQNVLAALVARSRDGSGRRIDLAMLDTMAYFNFPDLFQPRTVVPGDGEAQTPERYSAHSGVVATSDGFIVVVPVSGAQIGRSLEAVGHPEWKPELKAISDPVDLIDAVMSRIESVTRTASTKEWLARFAAHDVPAGPVLDLDGHLADDQVRHNAIYSDLDHPRLGRIRQVRYPALFDGEMADSARRPVPMPGEHTAEILDELGLRADDVNDLGSPRIF